MLNHPFLTFDVPRGAARLGVRRSGERPARPGGRATAAGGKQNRCLQRSMLGGATGGGLTWQGGFKRWYPRYNGLGWSRNVWTCLYSYIT